MTWRSERVQVERLGLQFEVEALGQHDLEDVPGKDVLTGHRHRGGVEIGRGTPSGRGQLVVAVGGHDDGLVYGLGPLGGELLQPLDGPVIEVGQLGRGGLGGHGHGLHQRDPLAPGVIGGALAHHRDDGVGIAELVGRRLRQPFDLPDDVVAEVADQAAVQRR